MAAKSVTPLFDVGEVVEYEDRQRRVQTGAVKAIEAHWYGRDPYIVYELEHPTYQGRHFYCGPESIIGVSL